MNLVQEFTVRMTGQWAYAQEMCPKWIIFEGCPLKFHKFEDLNDLDDQVYGENNGNDQIVLKIQKQEGTWMKLPYFWKEQSWRALFDLLEARKFGNWSQDVFTNRIDIFLVWHECGGTSNI